MLRSCLASTIFLLAWTCAPAAQETDAQAAEDAFRTRVRQQLKEQHDLIEELSARVAELEEKLRLLDAVRPHAAAAHGHALPEALRGLKLAPGANSEKVREYVRRIMDSCAGRMNSSSTDPEVDLLAAVGPKHVDILLEESESASQGRFYVQFALEQLVGEQHKSLILEALPRQHYLVDIVMAHSWVKDARDVLIDELRARRNWLPVTWVNAVIQLHEPQLYPDLVEYFIHGHNKAWTYRTLIGMRDLGIDLAGPVAEAWELAKSDPQRERGSMASVAAEWGHLDALEVLIRAVDLDPDGRDGIWQARETVAKLIDARGGAEELLRWLEENREKLEWDPKTHVYQMRK